MIDLAAIRRATGLTQIELAAKLGVRQAQISKIERQRDMLISTLASYLRALGVNAKIVVEVGEQTVTYDLTARRADGRTDHPRT
jgi:transcriptional regulator with XRE-family HTH domain